MKPTIHIIGDGYFGTFLKTLFADYAYFDDSADIKILAVPVEAYEEVASRNPGKHLVNVCSVQEETIKSCLKYTDKVTGVHPLFGPRSPERGRSILVTCTCPESDQIFQLFEAVGCEIVREMHGQTFTPQSHDQLMAKTHAMIIWFQEQLKVKLGTMEDVPDNCLTPSFKALRSFRDFVNELGDFSPGTLRSIKANKYLEE